MEELAFLIQEIHDIIICKEREMVEQFLVLTTVKDFYDSYGWVVRLLKESTTLLTWVTIPSSIALVNNWTYQ